MRKSSEGPLPRLSLNHGDDCMRYTETKGTLSFDLHTSHGFNKRSTKTRTSYHENGKRTINGSIGFPFLS